MRNQKYKHGLGSSSRCYTHATVTVRTQTSYFSTSYELNPTFIDFSQLETKQEIALNVYYLQLWNETA